MNLDAVVYIVLPALIFERFGRSNGIIWVIFVGIVGIPANIYASPELFAFAVFSILINGYFAVAKGARQ